MRYFCDNARHLVCEPYSIENLHRMAEGAIVLIVNGDKGSGFSCQAPLPVIMGLPAMLRSMAAQIEADQKSGHL